MGLLEIGENITGTVEAADLPTDYAPLYTFLDSHGVDATDFFMHFNNFVEVAQNKADAVSIGITATNLREVIFDGLIIDSYSAENNNHDGPPGPIYCYDKFIKDTQVVAARAVKEAAEASTSEEGAIILNGRTGIFVF